MELKQTEQGETKDKLTIRGAYEEFNNAPKGEKGQVALENIPRLALKYGIPAGVLTAAIGIALTATAELTGSVSYDAVEGVIHAAGTIAAVDMAAVGTILVDEFGAGIAKKFQNGYEKVKNFLKKDKNKDKETNVAVEEAEAQPGQE